MDDLLAVSPQLLRRPQEHPPQARRLTKPPIEGWTQLHFEYSAFVVLRQLSPAEPG